MLFCLFHAPVEGLRVGTYSLLSLSNGIFSLSFHYISWLCSWLFDTLYHSNNVLQLMAFCLCVCYACILCHFIKLSKYVFKVKVIFIYPMLISKFRPSFSLIDSEGWRVHLLLNSLRCTNLPHTLLEPFEDVCCVCVCYMQNGCGALKIKVSYHLIWVIL